MAWVYYKGKKRKIIDVIEHSYDEKGLINHWLYLESDSPKKMIRTSVLRKKGVHEPLDIKRQNDNLLKGFYVFKKERGGIR